MRVWVISKLGASRIGSRSTTGGVSHTGGGEMREWENEEMRELENEKINRLVNGVNVNNTRNVNNTYR